MARPVQYSIDHVLEQAMFAFWRHGFQATSLEDLISVTGIGKSSFYNKFNSKRDLYIRALEFYAEREVSNAVAVIEGGESPREAVWQLLNSVLERISLKNDRLGCLLCNTAIDVGNSDKAVASQVRKHFEPLQDALTIMFQSAGSSRPQAIEKAQQLLSIYTGVQVMSRAGFATEVLESVISQTVEQLP